MITPEELDYIRTAAIGDMLRGARRDGVSGYHFQAVPGTGTDGSRGRLAD